MLSSKIFSVYGQISDKILAIQNQCYDRFTLTRGRLKKFQFLLICSARSQPYDRELQCQRCKNLQRLRFENKMFSST
jgi:hypothetical protein